MQVDPKRYSSGKFIVSVPGILKMCTIILFLASSIIFLATPICTGTAPWYPRLYPIAAATSGVLTAVLYTCFAMGLVKKGFQVWGYVDLIFNMVDFIAMLAISILTTAACDNTTHSAQQVPGCLCLAPTCMLPSVSFPVFILLNYKFKRPEVRHARTSAMCAVTSFRALGNNWVAFACYQFCCLVCKNSHNEGSNIVAGEGYPADSYASV